ncbi:MAG: carboxypeptidase M32 [Candidatus Eiseniibacteriota bacterium]
MDQSFEALKRRWLEINDLSMAGALLRWDQTTYMPPGGSPARARQLATLGRLAHEKLADAETGKLIERLESENQNRPYDSDEAALLRVARREFEQASRVPASFISELSEHAAATYQVWTEARPANDFKRVRPLLERTLDLSRRYSGYFTGWKSIADPLIDTSDYGMKAAEIGELFGRLRERLVPLVRAITGRPPADDSCLRHTIPAERQLAFGLEVIRKFGYDFNRGRQDLTHHPFMTKFSLGDVRITTRVRESDFTDSLFSTLHECGHALYEQGIRMELEGTPLANGTSSGVHESQSRLWENLVGRGLPFWRHSYAAIQAAFPEALGRVALETFYAAINKVERTLIRTDSDEVTYNLHVMLRFGLELDLLEGRLSIADLPEAWRSRFQQDIGVAVPDDRNGVLQDVHWFAGPIGGVFQGYTLGNVLSAQFFAAARRAHPALEREIEAGEFRTLREWMSDNIYQHGSKFTAAEIVQRATGQPMSIEPYMEYLWNKYQPLYDLQRTPVTSPA